MNRFLLIVGLAATLVAGCKSTPAHKLPSNRCAFVTVTNCSSEQITAKAKTFFEDHGYESARPEEDVLVFQKPGGFWKTVWHGDWYSGPVWERIRLYQHEQEGQRTLIDCDLFMVQEHEDPLFQKEQRVNGKSSRCQKLLDELAAQLK